MPSTTQRLRLLAVEWIRHGVRRISNIRFAAFSASIPPSHDQVRVMNDDVLSHKRIAKIRMERCQRLAGASPESRMQL